MEEYFKWARTEPIEKKQLKEEKKRLKEAAKAEKIRRIRRRAHLILYARQIRARQSGQIGGGASAARPSFERFSRRPRGRRLMNMNYFVFQRLVLSIFM